MPVRKIVSLFRAWKEKRQDNAERQSAALQLFLARLEDAFPGRTLPGKKRADELALIARERAVRRAASYKELIGRLNRLGVDADFFSKVATEAAENPRAFAKRWVVELTQSGQVTLSNLKARQLDVFPMILVVLRDLYASDESGDLGDDIFVRDVARIVVETVLTKPAKRA